MADNDIFEVNEGSDKTPRNTAKPQPLYRIYKDSKIAISKHVGKMWKQRHDAAVTAYTEIWKIWDECFRYYNNAQTKGMDTPRGIFKRGDSTENVVFSNLNIMLPAIYGKNPDITCSTTDEEDEPFCKALEALVNALFRRRTFMNVKPKAKRAAGFAVLTNQGILKLDFTLKDDSREMAVREMTELTAQLAKCETPQEAEEVYGRLEALEMQLEVLQPSGPSLGNVLPQNLIVDPSAEQADGSDAKWMIECAYLPTSMLRQRFTIPDPEGDGDERADRVLIYQPTHKAQFVTGANGRDDALGIVLDAIQAHNNQPISNTEDERTAYMNMYYTQCYFVWDKVTRMLLLFHRDDWTWPIWIWDDPLKISRFFPYFLISFAMSTGGVTGPGETAYYLDQQDDLNDINRKLSRIRRSVFDFVFYNSEAMDEAEVEGFLRALRGDTTSNKTALGIRAGDKKVSDMFQVMGAPELEYEVLFNKQGIYDTINRISNTSDALRGVQFKTNTNVAAVNTYQESMRLSVGAKVDVVEDVIGDLGVALSELCVQHYQKDEVEGLIGKALASGWRNMSVQEFNAQYSLELVAGSLEKPNSVFKKKESIEVSQAIGQFARAAPASTLTIVLRLLQQAFSEVVVKPEDFAAINQEAQANLQRGVSSGEPGGAPGAPGQQQSGSSPEDIVKNLPPEVKQEVAKMKQRNVPDEQIAQFVQQEVNKMKGQSNGSRPEPAR